MKKEQVVDMEEQILPNDTKIKWYDVVIVVGLITIIVCWFYFLSLQSNG